jgi:hypothetical protein
MTPERKKEIKHKLMCVDIWDESKMEFHRMLSEAIEHIDDLEETISFIEDGEVLDGKRIYAWECRHKDCPGHVVGLEGLPGLGHFGCPGAYDIGNRKK